MSTVLEESRMQWYLYRPSESPHTPTHLCDATEWYSLAMGQCETTLTVSAHILRVAETIWKKRIVD